MQACLQGLKHLIELRRWPANLESDYLRAVQTTSSRGHELSSSWALVQEARDLLELYHDIDIRKVDRVNNGMAHVLTQVGKSGFSGFLRDAVLACVQDLIIIDCNTM
jgi:hypothetical protein